MRQCSVTSPATDLLRNMLERLQPESVVSNWGTKRYYDDTCAISPAETDKEAAKASQDDGPGFQPSIWELSARLGLLGVRLFNLRLFDVWVHGGSANCRIH